MGSQIALNLFKFNITVGINLWILEGINLEVQFVFSQRKKWLSCIITGNKVKKRNLQHTEELYIVTSKLFFFYNRILCWLWCLPTMEVLAPIEILSCPYNQTTTHMGQSSSPLANTMWRNKTPTVSSTSPSLEGKPLKLCVKVCFSHW